MSKQIKRGTVVVLKCGINGRHPTVRVTRADVEAGRAPRVCLTCTGKGKAIAPMVVKEVVFNAPLEPRRSPR